MNKLVNNPLHATPTTTWKILDFIFSFVGSLLAGNIGIVLLALFDTPELWSIYFTQFWRFAFACLAIFVFLRKRSWVSPGILAAVFLQALEI